VTAVPDLQFQVVQLQHTVNRILEHIRHLERVAALPLPAHAAALLSDDEMAALMGVTTMTIYRKRKRGEMPPIVEISPNRHGTRLSDYLKHIEAHKK